MSSSNLLKSSQCCSNKTKQHHHKNCVHVGKGERGDCDVISACSITLGVTNKSSVYKIPGTKLITTLFVPEIEDILQLVKFDKI